jgi:hypothetical protein
MPKSGIAGAAYLRVCRNSILQGVGAASVAQIAWYSAFPVTVKLPHFCADNGMQNWDYDFDVASNLRRRQRVPQRDRQRLPATWRVV